MRYRVNTPLVLSEMVDNEIIILNMQTGKYYQVLGVGATVWKLFSNAYTLEEASEAISKHFSITPDTATADLTQFLNLCTTEGLLVTEETDAATATVDLPSNLDYSTPELQIHSDMEKLLLLDPIHQVEDIGWPNKKEDSGSKK